MANRGTAADCCGPARWLLHSASHGGAHQGAATEKCLRAMSIEAAYPSSEDIHPHAAHLEGEAALEPTSTSYTYDAYDDYQSLPPGVFVPGLPVPCDGGLVRCRPSPPGACCRLRCPWREHGQNSSITVQRFTYWQTPCCQFIQICPY